MFKVKVGNNSGFTFMELLFVMLVIGIMAAVFLPSFVKSQVDTQLADRVIADIKLRSEAIRWYYLDQKTAPATWSNLKTQNYLPSTLPDTGPLGSYVLQSTTNPTWINEIKIANVPDGVIRKTILNSIASATLSGNDLIIGVVKPGQEASLAGLRQDIYDALSKLPRQIIYSGILASGDTVTKPTCPGGMVPKIFVSPVVARASNTGYSIVGEGAYAVDNGSSWTVQGVVKASNGNVYTDANSIRVLTYVICDNT